jgi:hypothetical protein
MKEIDFDKNNPPRIREKEVWAFSEQEKLYDSSCLSAYFIGVPGFCLNCNQR